MMGIDLIIRGNDLTSAGTIQKAIFRALNHEIKLLYHGLLLINSKKVSKSDTANSQVMKLSNLSFIHPKSLVS
jgi:glutamyl/glutaminyl-tRNA synthetase